MVALIKPKDWNCKTKAAFTPYLHLQNHSTLLKDPNWTEDKGTSRFKVEKCKIAQKPVNAVQQLIIVGTFYFWMTEWVTVTRMKNV